jgi:hypothetical protein
MRTRRTGEHSQKRAAKLSHTAITEPTPPAGLSFFETMFDLRTLLSQTSPQT